MGERRKKVPDPAVYAAIVRVMMRVGPAHLTLAAIAAEAGLTPGALVQRFGSKRALMLAHARHAAGTGDIGLKLPERHRSALGALRGVADPFVQMAASRAAALRSLAYLQRDLADDALHSNLLKMSRMARQDYRQRVADAVTAGALRPDTPVATLARAIETALIGSVVNWTIYREGSAARWIRKDLDALLAPYLAGGPRTRRRPGHVARPLPTA